MNYEPPTFDEVRCDRCGQPTSRLDPPADTELCDDCWDAERQAVEERVGEHIREMLDRQDAQKVSA